MAPVSGTLNAGRVVRMLPVLCASTLSFVEKADTPLATPSPTSPTIEGHLMGPVGLDSPLSVSDFLESS